MTIAGGTDIVTEMVAGTLTVNFNGTVGATNLNGLSDVSTANAKVGSVPKFNGTSFAMDSDASITWTIGANGASDYTIKSSDNVSFNDPTITLIRGKTYEFDMSDSSNAIHPLRFSTTRDGTHGGGSIYSDGVTLSSGRVTITINASSPSTLYYFCLAHGNQGGRININ